MMPLLFTLALGEKISTQAIVEESWKRTLVVGHRGAAAYKPENTIPSFEEAIASGAVAAECDVYTAKDGGVIIMHDGTLDRTTSLKGPITDYTVAEMVAAGVPTLKQYTDTTKDRIVSVIEIKNGVDISRKVVDHIRTEKMVDQTIVFSFSEKFVREVKELEPKLFTVWLKGAPTDLDAHFAAAHSAKVDAIGVDFKGATPEIVARAHQEKMPIFVWTVPPGPEVDRLKALKVNFIITNHPRDVRKQLSGE